MNVVDVLVLLGVALLAVLGSFRGLTAQVLSLGGLALGALAGSLLAPYLLADNSPWTPLAGLIGAAVGAFALSAFGAAIAGPVQVFLAARPPLALIDRVGGILVEVVLFVVVTLTAPLLLAAQVRRMLKDPKAAALVENFGAQWLQPGLVNSTTSWGGSALGSRWRSIVSASDTSYGSPSTFGSTNIFSTTPSRTSIE